MVTLTAARRRALGAYFTPADVCDRLVAIALESRSGTPTVCDPACGDGAFLLATARALEARGVEREVIAHDLLFGCDLEPAHVAEARAAIVAWSGVDPGDHLAVGDGLELGERWAGRFDAAVGNPPFLNQLERATVRPAPVPPALGPYDGAYTDTAWLFLVVARRLLRVGGRAVVIQPQSVVSARDAACVRDALGSELAGLWWCDDRIFENHACVCAVVLDAGAPARQVRRWQGRAVEPVAPAPRSTEWAELVPTGAPEVELTGPGTLADLATATAGFRDEYYGLVGHVVDEPGGDDPLLVTCGLVDPGGMAWGRRPARFAGESRLHPRVRVQELTGRVGQWVEQRLVPKLVVATQTRVVEAAVDEHGTWVPSTPLISVQPHAGDLWPIAAVLLAPAVSAWALRRSAGAALAAGTIKLSARQVLDVPLPPGRGAWAGASRALRSGDMRAAGALMDEAYCADAYAWWSQRLPTASLTA